MIGSYIFAGDFFSLIVDDIPGSLLKTHIVCICRDGAVLYQMDDTEQERLGAQCLCKTNDSTAIEEVSASQPSFTKVMRNGQIYISRNGKMYNIMGVEM